MHTTIHDIKGSQPPEAWAKQTGRHSDQEVDITIIDRKKSMEEFRRLARTIGRRVEQYGDLTEEDIQKEVASVRAERYGK